MTVVDVGPPADWVKINVQRTVCYYLENLSNPPTLFYVLINSLFKCPQEDCFEVYALVPGLVREEVSSFSHTLGVESMYILSLCTCELILANNNTGPSPIRSGRTVGNKWRTREPYESMGSYSFQKGNVAKNITRCYRI